MAKLLPSTEYSFALSDVLRQTYVFGARVPEGFLTLRSRSLKHGDVVPFSPPMKFDEIEVIPLPGHSAGMVGYLIGKVIYAGDAVFGDRLIRKVGLPFLPDLVSAL